MIKCHLSMIMGQSKLKIVVVAAATGMNRSGVSALYNESAQKVDLASISALCKLFDCDVSDIFEYIEDEEK